MRPPRRSVVAWGDSLALAILVVLTLVALACIAGIAASVVMRFGWLVPLSLLGGALCGFGLLVVVVHCIRRWWRTE